MKIHFIRYIAFLAAFTAFSCSKNPSGGEDSALPLLFSAETDEMQMKSGAGENSIKTTATNLKDHPFGVYGIYTDTEGALDGTNVFLASAAQEVSYDNLNAKWVYSPIEDWVLYKYYRFRAFHPYSGDAITLNSLSDADRIVIEYASAAGQEDLLVGFKTVKSEVTTITQKVKIEFEHALSALEFKIAFKKSDDIADDYTDNYTDNITNFYLTGLIPTGTLIYGHPTGDYLTPIIDWNATYYDGDGIYFEWTGSKKFGKIDQTDPDTGKEYPVSVFDGDELVFCVPQTCSSSASKPTIVHFKTQSSEAENSILLPSIEWKPGKIYTYTLLVNKSDIDLEITVKDWTKIQSNEDIYL